MVGGNAFGFGFEVQDKPMTHGGRSHRLDVIEADVETALGERADFSGQSRVWAPRGLLPNRRYWFETGDAVSVLGCVARTRRTA